MIGGKIFFNATNQEGSTAPADEGDGCSFGKRDGTCSSATISELFFSIWEVREGDTTGFAVRFGKRHPLPPSQQREVVLGDGDL